MVTLSSWRLALGRPESVPRTMLQVLLVDGELLVNNFAIDEPVELVDGVGEVGSLLHNRRSPPFDFLCPGSLYCCMVLCLQFLGGLGVLHSSVTFITIDSFSLCNLNMLNFMSMQLFSLDKCSRHTLVVSSDACRA